MIQRFHLAKHWQLFLLFFALPFFGIICFCIVFFDELFHLYRLNSTSSPQQALTILHDLFTFLFTWIAFFIILVNSPLFIWQWSIGVRLQSKLTEGFSMNVGLFKGFLIYTHAFQIAYLFFMWWAFESMFNMQISMGRGQIPNFGAFFRIMSMMVIFIPLSFFAAFCSIYTFRFSAKTLNSIELGREAHFGEYIGDFFLILLAPIGVWFIQPRVNDIVLNMPSKQKFVTLGKPVFSPTTNQQNALSEPEKDLPNVTSNGNPFEHDDEFDGLF